MNIKGGQYLGMYGMKGLQQTTPLNRAKPDTSACSARSVLIPTGRYLLPRSVCHNSFAFEASRLQEADVVGGFWAVRQQWLRLLFRETPVTWLSGEDYHMTSAVHLPLPPSPAQSFLPACQHHSRQHGMAAFLVLGGRVGPGLAMETGPLEGVPWK